MYNVNQGINMKDILYSAQKNPKNKNNYKNFTSEFNKKYPPFSKGKINKYKNNSLVYDSKNINNNMELNLNNINSQFSSNENNNNNTFNIKSKNSTKIMFINQNINDAKNNDNSSLYFQMNINMKDNNKQEYTNIYNSSEKQKKFIRNLSEEQQVKKNNTNFNYQKNSLRKESSLINKILYNKSKNIFHEVPDNMKNKIQYNINMNKGKSSIYKEILSKSSFNNSIQKEGNNNFIFNNNDIIKNNNTLNNNNYMDIKPFKYQNSLKSIIPKKGKYKIANNNGVNIVNNNNPEVDILKQYINKRKLENNISKKNISKKNNIQLSNNLLKNDTNILVKIKTNSYTPINNTNCIFTNPNNDYKKNQNFIIRDSLINENNNNFRLSLKEQSKDKKFNDKSCPKFNINKNTIPSNHYTNINNINNNNNYIVNVNKYINIENKKSKIVKKSGNSNDIKAHNYSSYKSINHHKNNLKKSINEKYEIKNNNYMNSPNGFNIKKFKSVNENVYLPSYYKGDYNPNVNEPKNNYISNTKQSNNDKKIGFKKVKTCDYINRNNLKNENIYDYAILNANMKMQRQKRFESKLKSSILDSNSFKLFKKSNTNTSILKDVNNINNNDGYNHKTKYMKNKLYNEYFSTSNKKLNSSQRNSHNNYTNTHNLNNNSNNNNNYGTYIKGRNDKYNLGVIFKPQTTAQKMDLKLNKINSNRNPDINMDSHDSKTISLIGKEKDNFENKFKSKITNNFNLIMKTVQEYKNKNKNKKMRYDNNINENKKGAKNVKKLSDYHTSNINTNNIITNKKSSEQKNAVFKQKIKKSYNPPYSEMNLKFFKENKILQNISKNTLTMFSIYILSHYYSDCNKIGLSKITLLNRNKKPIPVLCSNNNCGKDANKLFINSSITKNNEYSKPFITEFKNDIYINFYINNMQANNIKYIQILNYTDIKNKVSPVAKIKICQGKNVIFKGILSINNINQIEISNYKCEENDNLSIKEIQDLNDDNEISINKYNNGNNRPYSMSKYKSMEDEVIPSDKNNYISNSEYDNYYTTRGGLYKGFSNLIECYDNKENKWDNNENEENYYDSKILLNYDNDEEEFNMNSLKNNDFEIDSLLSQKLSMEFNKTANNTHNNTIKSNHVMNENYEMYNTNNNSINKMSNSNSNNNINKTNATLNNNVANDVFFNLLRKTYNKNEVEDFDQIFRTSMHKMREYSSFHLKSNNSKGKNKSNTGKKDNNKNIDINSYNEKEQEDSFSNINFINENINFDNNNMYNNIEAPNYIEFNKIRFIISSNYGHHKYVGLTGIELFNVKGDSINIETALTIGALPKDLRTLYNDEKENRIFENVFNKINDTNDSDNMWVTRLKKNNPLPFIELYFKEKLRVSKIKIYNYNEKDKLNIGAKTIELYLDDEYYNTIYLKQGTGEIAFDFIKIKNKSNIKNNNNEMVFDLDDSETNDNEDFGQDITFPIQDINHNDLVPFRSTFFSSFNSNFNHSNSNNNTINDNSNNNTSNNKNKVKFASFLYKQCYETPYLPCGYYIKLILNSNYYKGVAPIEESDLLKYNAIGFNRIEIYDEDGRNLIGNNKDSNNDINLENQINYKIISNCEIFHNEDEDENNKEGDFLDNKIIINGAQNDSEKETGNNCLFYIFDKPVRISYIKFYPLEEDNKPILNTAKEIKIFSDCRIIFEGMLHFDKPTVVLFTCERKIINNIDENYLTNEINERDYKEEKKDNYISLILN